MHFRTWLGGDFNQAHPRPLVCTLANNDGMFKHHSLNSNTLMKQVNVHFQWISEASFQKDLCQPQTFFPSLSDGEGCAKIHSIQQVFNSMPQKLHLVQSMAGRTTPSFLMVFTAFRLQTALYISRCCIV